jgi:hypothetical protein
MLEKVCMCATVCSCNFAKQLLCTFLQFARSAASLYGKLSLCGVSFQFVW